MAHVIRNTVDRVMYKADTYRANRSMSGHMFGYVITSNRTGSAKGFWSPFPRFVASVTSRLLRDNDWWAVRDELEYRHEFKRAARFESEGR